MQSTPEVPRYGAAWLRRAERDGIDRAEALDAFNSLATVPADTMIGHWRGSGLHTGHALDGMLERFGWYGKAFVDSETVFPLLFSSGDGKTVAIDPRFLPFRLAARLRLQDSRIAAGAFRAGRFLITTRRPTARLRMTDYRGRTSATMIYDTLPINDIFRRVDAATLLGIMDCRGFDTPFFFVLRCA